MLLDNNGTWPETQPAWSPDGGRIAFTSTRSGSPNIWVLSLLEVSGFTTGPQPFSPPVSQALSLSYQLSASNTQINLSILNASDNSLVKVLRQDWESSGPKSAVWDGRDVQGHAVPDGDYIASLTATGLADFSPKIQQLHIAVDGTPPSVVLSRLFGGFLQRVL